MAIDEGGVGEESARVFGLNRDVLVDGRGVAWLIYQSVIVCYDRISHALLNSDVPPALARRPEIAALFVAP